MNQNDCAKIVNVIGLINRAAEQHQAEQNTSEEQAFFQGILRGCELITNQLQASFVMSGDSKVSA